MTRGENIFSKPVLAHYQSGKPYFTVECKDCSIVLNSGHHYKFLNQAELVALEHDSENHQ